MADLQISQLPALAEAGVQSTDVLAVADLSASETKKVTVKDLLAAGVALIDAGDIPAAKVGTLGTNQVATAAIQDSAVTNAKLANSSISLGGLSLSLGSTDATPALNLSDATNYPTSSLSGTITNAQLAGSITGDKLANSTVAFAKLNLSDGDIGGAKITSASITSTQLAANSVGASQIAANAVGTGEIAQNAVTNVEIASATIQTGNIAAAQITASLLANDAVTSDKIQNGAVTAEKLSGTIQAGTLADNAVTTAKIADDAVTAAKLGLNSVDSNALADNSVDTNAVANSAITDAKIAGVAGTKITAGTIPASALNTSNINRGLNVASGNIGIQNAVSGGAATKSGITYTAQGLISGIVDLVPSDLPTATASAAGAASFPSSGGLSITGAGAVSIAATVSGSTVSGITFNNFGQITAASGLSSSDLPTATASAKGAVSIPTGGPLSINGSGQVTVSDSGVTAGTGVKVTVSSKGIVTNLASLADSDLPNHSAALFTSGTLDIARIGANVITGNKLANASTVLFGSVDQTGFPSSQFTGQFFFDSVLEDLYIFDGNAYQPVTTLTKGSLIFGGTYDASQSKMTSVTAAGASKGLSVNSNLPTPSSSMDGVFVIVAVGGTPSAPAPVTALNPPDYILGVTSAGASSYQEIDLSATVQGQIASNVSYTPFGQISATNLQAAVNELETEKVSTSGATFTGPIIIDSSGSNTGSLSFEGSTADNFETTLGVVDPTTSDKTLLLPNENGTLISSGGTGTVTSTMILDGTILNADINASAAIALTKLENVQAARLIVGSSSNVPTAVAITGDIGISDSGVTSISAGAIVNADISNSAQITGSKVVTGTTSAVGVLQLTDSATSTSATTAATPAAVKIAKDAADAAAATANAALPKAGGTMTGNLIIDNGKELRLSESDSDGSNFTAIKVQAQSSDITLTLPAVAPTAGKVLKASSGTPTTLEWADDSATDATKLPLAGGTMSGAIAMGTSKITGLGDPTAAQDAATKTYVDTANALKLNLSGGSLTGNLTLNAQSDLRFADSDSSHFVALQSPGTVASSFTLTLPSTDAPVNGYVLASDGSGTLSWVDPGSSSSPTFTGDVSLTNDGALVGFSNLSATYTGNTKTFTVTVASKTGAHRYNGSGSSQGYKINGKEAPFLTLTPGRTYRFDQADSSNSGHPLRFYLEANKTTSFSTGVTINGTAGSSGAYTEITVTDTTPQILHYQCSAHGFMGNSVQANSKEPRLIEGDLTLKGAAQNIEFDQSSNLLWFKTNAQGGPSAKIHLGDGISYGNLEVSMLSNTAFIGTRHKDLEIHSGDSSDIELWTSKDINFINSSNATNYYLRCKENSGSDQNVELYYGQGGTGKKLETTNTGVTITGTAVATSFTGALTGDVTGTASQASTVNVTAKNTNAQTVYPLFAGVGATATGYLTPSTDTGLTYNPSTGELTATKFTGNGSTLTALNASNISSGTIAAARVPTLNQNTTGTAATVTGAAQSAITSLGTLTSLGISGNLTVDTNTLHVDATNNRVGIGLTSPAKALHVKSTGSILRLETTATTGSNYISFFDADENKAFIGLGSGSDDSFSIWNLKNDAIRIATNNTERMRIDSSGKVGIGTTSPAAVFESRGSSDIMARFRDSSNGIIDIRTTGTGNADPVQINAVNRELSFAFNSSEKMKIDTSGRLLLGTTTEGEAAADDLTIATSGHTGITIRSGTSNYGNLFFSDGTSGGAEYAGYVQYNHSTNALNLGANASTALTLDSSQNATFVGTVTATSFSGSGANLTNLPASGGSVDLTANGAIAANKPVIVNSSGQAEQVGIGSDSLGSAVQHGTGSHRTITISDPTDTSKYVIVSSQGSTLKLRVASVSGTTISFGTEVSYSPGATVSSSDMAGVYISSRDCYMLAHKGPSNYYYAVCFTVSGTSITMGSRSSAFDSYAGEYISLAVGDSSDGWCSAFFMRSTGPRLWIKGVKPASTVTSAPTVGGGQYIAGYGSLNQFACAFNADQGYFYGVFNASDGFHAEAWTQSSSNGNPSRVGVQDNITSSFLASPDIVYEPNIKKMIVAYRSGNNGKFRVINYTGSAWQAYSTYSEHTWGSSTSPGNIRMRNFPGTNKLFISYTQSSSTKLIEVTINSDSSYSNGTITTTISSSADEPHISAITTGIGYGYAQSGSAYGKFFKVGVTNATTANFIGFADAAINSGSSGTINVVSGTTTQSSLTAGEKYFVQKDGTLATTADTISIEAGIALSSTKLLIKG